MSIMKKSESTKKRGWLTNRSSITNLFIHSVSSSFRIVLLLAAFLTLATSIPCLADDSADANEYSWLRTGFFCFRTSVGTNNQVHLVKYEHGKFDELFTRTMKGRVYAPICLTNGVIAVNVYGVICRLDLKGEYVFEAKPKGFEGLVRESGRLDDNHIFMVETVRNKQNNDWLYYLDMVDISGKEPVLKTKFDIIPPVGITQTMDEIIVIGETNVQRLDVPPDYLKEPKGSK